MSLQPKRKGAVRLLDNWLGPWFCSSDAHFVEAWLDLFDNLFLEARGLRKLWNSRTIPGNLLAWWNHHIISYHVTRCLLTCGGPRGLFSQFLYFTDHWRLHFAKVCAQSWYGPRPRRWPNRPRIMNYIELSLYHCEPARSSTHPKYIWQYFRRGVITTARITVLSPFGFACPVSPAIKWEGKGRGW